MDQRARVRISGGEIVGAQHPEGGFVWRGIRYAAPPVGEWRWRAPRTVAPWDGVAPALSPGAPALQPDATLKTFGSEDCLFLNIWSPQAPADLARGAGLPVMVWVHGGGNVIGQGDAFDGARLVLRQNVLVVTFNYRLGVLGWFSHAALRETAETEDDRSGNFGLLDIIAALRWVRQNIAHFGGDPACVTIFGESAGGCNVLAMLASPRAKGLFDRAIVQSGYPFTTSIPRAANYADADEPGTAKSGAEVSLRLVQGDFKISGRAAAKAHVTRTGARHFAAYLRSKTFDELNAAAMEIPDTDVAMLFAGGAPQMFRDGAVLPEEGALAAFRRGAHNQTPVLIGATRDELTILMAMQAPTPFTELAPNGTVRIPNMARFRMAAEYASAIWRADQVHAVATALSEGQKAPLFVYRFDWSQLAPAPWWDDLQLGATHGIDVPFIFGHLNLGPEFVQVPLFQEKALESFDAMSRAVMAYWGAFARNGDPADGEAGLPRWRAWRDGANVRVLDWPLPSEDTRSDETRASILNRVATDARLSSEGERTAFLRDLMTVRGAGLQIPDKDR